VSLAALVKPWCEVGGKTGDKAGDNDSKADSKIVNKAGDIDIAGNFMVFILLSYLTFALSYTYLLFTAVFIL
jgi:hypothetical protein